MSAVLKHLSVGVSNPKVAAEALAALTEGKVQPFHPVEGAYVCLWPDWQGQFVEFYPLEVQLAPTVQGAQFKTTSHLSPYSSVHLNLETPVTLEKVKKLANQYGYQYHYRPSDGGPLHEVWIENALLIELITPELL